MAELEPTPAADRRDAAALPGPLLRVEGLACGHGHALVLSGISFELQPGRSLALLGRNGAGKTTLIDTLVGVAHLAAARSAGRIVSAGREIQGLAPYWFEVGATAYLGGNGRTALRLGAEYDVLLTQKLILQPRAEFSLYGKDDVAREIGSGLSNGVIGLRLRYEINRHLAPYIGVERSSKFGQTADLARAGGERTAETRWVAGVRFWF